MLEGAKMVAVIPVHDLSKARVFYEKMLGLVPSGDARAERELIYSLGDGRVMVYETTAELGGATKVTLMVENLDKEMTDLKNHGVKFEDFDVPGLKTVGGVAEDEHGRAAWFKDLEGNWIALSESQV